MTDRELMQQALEALEHVAGAMPFPVALQVRAALRERLAQPDSCGHESCDCRAYCKKQQPAQQQGLQDLWHKAWPEAGAFVRASADDLTRFAQAVSSAPQPAQQQSAERVEPVAERFEAMHAKGDVWITTIAAAAIARNTSPPPNANAGKPWVGLDAGDWNKIVYTSEFRAGADWAEAKLREKNGGGV